MVTKMFHVSSLLMPKREEVWEGVGGGGGVGAAVEEWREGRVNERRDLSSHLLSI